MMGGQMHSENPEGFSTLGTTKVPTTDALLGASNTCNPPFRQASKQPPRREHVAFMAPSHRSTDLAGASKTTSSATGIFKGATGAGFCGTDTLDSGEGMAGASSGEEVLEVACTLVVIEQALAEVLPEVGVVDPLGQVAHTDAPAQSCSEPHTQILHGPHLAQAKPPIISSFPSRFFVAITPVDAE
jgi:hypothetical protein